MSKIRILVACHKECELPRGEIYLPIQVGAKNANKNLGIQRDDEGENISEKNPTYCELTAQYWAWKNLDADYYGLCHYRRFLCLNGLTFGENDRNQVEAEVLNDYSQEKYGLIDCKNAREMIKKYDVIVAKEQSINKVFTPYGRQANAMKHWEAHDRYLISKKDLKAMLQILKDKYPEIGAATEAYLKTKNFLGFNCFIMKKKYFNELSEIEFSVLAELEKKVDRSNYNFTLNRIFGFMGEIIFSGYVYYLEKNRLAKINRVEMVNFRYTEPLKDAIPRPAFPEVKESVPIFYYQNVLSAEMYCVCAKSLEESLNKDKFYDLIFMHNNIDAYFLNKIKSYFIERKNVSVRFLDNHMVEAIGREKNDGITYFAGLSLPFLCESYKKAVVMAAGSLVRSDPGELLKNLEQKMLVAPHDKFWVARANEGYPKYYIYLKDKLRINKPLDYFDAGMVAMNFKKIREKISPSVITDIYEHFNEMNLEYDEVMNIIYQDVIDFTDEKWQIVAQSNGYLKLELQELPLWLFKENNRPDREVGSYKFLPAHICDGFCTSSEFLDIFMDEAKRAGVYETVFRQILKEKRIGSERKRVNDLFPVGSTRRKILGKIFPVGSKRYEAVSKLQARTNR